MPRRKDKTKPAAAARVETSRLTFVVIAGMMALLTGRWMLPAEASIDGETLWFVQGWLALAGLWIWDGFRTGRRLFVFDWLTLGVCLLVAGHVISGLAVFANGGDKRAAMNVMWEWISLGIAYLIVRSYCQQTELARRLLWGLTGVAVALAGLGLYQYHVSFPEMRAEFQSVIEQFDEIQAEGRTGTDYEVARRRQRTMIAMDRLRKYGISIHNPAARQLLERRINSTEPFGPFALANTFAGLLAAFLLIAAGGVIGGLLERRGWPLLLGPGIALGLLLYCLLLTKSRTAWVGGLAGIVFWLIVRGGLWNKRGLVWISGGVVAMAVAVGAVSIAGGLDWETLTESPKSVQYRLEYWTASVNMLGERPLLGSGPGNFRQHYLAYKLPGSSEEIRDPHNAFLDVWSNGGLIGLIGLLIMLSAAAMKIVPVETEVGESTSNTSRRESMAPWLIGSLGGILLVALVSWFFDDGLAGRHYCLLIGTAIAMLMTTRAFGDWSIPRPTIIAAAIALLVHLLGAGGIEMPAITQLVLILVALIADYGRAIEEDTVQEQSGSRTVAAIAGTAVALVLFGACLSTASLPVMTRDRLLAEAQYSFESQRDYRRAARYYKEAAAADPFSPIPTRELALRTHTEYRRQSGNTAVLDSAIQQMQYAIEMDPHHFSGYWHLGNWLIDRSILKNSREDADAGVEAYEQAVVRYPHHAKLLYDFAERLYCLGRKDKAAEQATAALDLDDLNRTAGHRDKYLPEEARKRLQKLADGTADWKCD